MGKVRCRELGAVSDTFMPVHRIHGIYLLLCVQSVPMWCVQFHTPPVHPSQRAAVIRHLGHAHICVCVSVSQRAEEPVKTV